MRHVFLGKKKVNLKDKKINYFFTNHKNPNKLSVEKHFDVKLSTITLFR